MIKNLFPTFDIGRALLNTIYMNNILVISTFVMTGRMEVMFK